MTQTITTDLAALATKPNDAISLIGDDDVCATCGHDLRVTGDGTAALSFCPDCYTVDLTSVQVTLAALAWARDAGHRVDELDATECTNEDDERPPGVIIPGRYWHVAMSVVDGPWSVSCPLYVVQQPDGGMQVVPDDFPTCRNQDGHCDHYLTTDDDGTRRCPEHGEVTAWGIPVSFYVDDPDVLAQDAADFARLGTVQWFEDYPEDDDEDGE